MLTPVVIPNAMEMSMVISAQQFIQVALASGIENGKLYCLMSGDEDGWQMIPQPNWIGLANPFEPLPLFATFGTPPTSEAVGNYVNVGLANYDRINQPNMTMKQICGLA